MASEDNTAVSIRDYIDSALTQVEHESKILHQAHSDLHEELRRAVDLSATATAERVKVALESIERRLSVLNEFRASLEDSLKNNVHRDLFDIVTNRLTVVENTYLKKEDYASDGDRQRERTEADFVSRDTRLAAVEGYVIASGSMTERDRRLAELEKNTVKQSALQAQTDEVQRTRKALVYTIVGGVILTMINLMINAYQAPGG